MALKKYCDDTCENCLYIGEGDFICDILHVLVIEDWVPLNDGICIKDVKCSKHDKKNKIAFFTKKGIRKADNNV